MHVCVCVFMYVFKAYPYCICKILLFLVLFKRLMVSAANVENGDGVTLPPKPPKPAELSVVITLDYSLRAATIRESCKTG